MKEEKNTNFEEEVKTPKVKLKFKKKSLTLNEKADSKAEYDRIKEELKNIYKDTLVIDRKLVLKCMSLTCSQENERIHLPYNVIVDKKGNELIFSSPKISNAFLVLLFTTTLAFVTIAASYSAIDFLSKADLNKDIDGDGIADINLDLNEDDIAEINIDTNDDNKPDINIDYKGNKKSVFNIDTNEDNKADSNLITPKKGGLCKKTEINCDIDGDGWPDVNIDLLGKGKANMDIDTNEDGVIDLNIDTDGDGVCNVNCDSNDDWKCDYSCVTETKILTVIQEVPRSGSSSQLGNPNTTINTSSTLEVVFIDKEELLVNDLYPTDQPGMEPMIPTKTFTVENKSGNTQHYNLKWIVYSNTFDITSENMKYMVSSENNGGELGWTTVPRTDYTFLTNISIAPYVKQTYTVSLKLHGIEAAQNYDKGKTFSGKIQVELTNPTD